MKKILILTLIFIITISSFVGCNNAKQPNETTKQTCEDADTNKPEVKEKPKQPEKENKKQFDNIIKESYNSFKTDNIVKNNY